MRESSRLSAMALLTAIVATLLWVVAVPSLAGCSVIFADQVEYDVGSFPNGVAIGDINGDDFLDIVAANVLTEDVSVLHGQQDGTFAPESRFAAGGDAPLVELGDLDQDMDLDVVVGLQSAPNVFAVLRNTGAGELSAPLFYGSMTGTPREIILADFDLDSDLDVAVVVAGGGAGRVAVFFNLGSGTFSSQTIYTIQETSIDGGLGTGDLDEDDDLDLVACFVYSNVSPARLTNTGNGTFVQEDPFETTTSATPAIAVGDLNGDTVDDIAIIKSGEIRVYLNNGSGSFSNFTGFTSPVLTSSVTRMTLGDLDGNGALDLVVTGSSSDQVGVLLNDGSGVLGNPSAHATGDFCGDVVVGDLNGDLFPDVVASNRDGGSVSVLLSESPITSVNSNAHSADYLLGSSVPNPTRGKTEMFYQIPRTTQVKVAVYDAVGRLVEVLHDGVSPQGTHWLTWDGRSASGGRASSGIYIVLLAADQFRQTRTLVLLH